MAIPMAAVLQMIGMGVSAYGERQQAKLQAANMEYEAYVAEQDAQNLEKAGELEKHKLRTAQRKLLARQVALAAASGRDISGGSPLAIMEASERAFLLDQQIISYNTARATGAKLAESQMVFGMSRSVNLGAKLGLYASLLGITAKGAKHFNFKDKVVTPQQGVGGGSGDVFTAYGPGTKKSKPYYKNKANIDKLRDAFSPYPGREAPVRKRGPTE